MHDCYIKYDLIHIFKVLRITIFPLYRAVSIQVGLLINAHRVVPFIGNLFNTDPSDFLISFPYQCLKLLVEKAEQTRAIRLHVPHSYH